METASKIDLIQQFPIFESLTDEERAKLSSYIDFRTKPKYSYIYMPGESSKYVYFLAKGTIKIGTHSNDGREVIKAILHPAAMFGELGLVGELERQDFARAMNAEVHLGLIRVEDFQSLMESNHQLSMKIITLLGNRLRKAENRLESLIFKDARTRIIDFLKDSVEKRGKRIGYEMLLKHSLTQQDIANLTGTSRQTVTSVLNELRKSDLIYFNRRSILIRDVATLA